MPLNILSVLALIAALSGVFYTGVRFERYSLENRVVKAENKTMINFIEGQQTLNEQMQKAMDGLANEKDLNDALPGSISRTIDRMPTPIRKPASR